MDRRQRQIGFKLALTTMLFLCLTMITAAGLRRFLQPASTGLDRGPASAERGSVFEHRGNLSPNELGLLASEPLVRGRRVLFHDVLFRNQALSAPHQVVLNLFPDVSLTAQLQTPSIYGVNDGLFVGQIVGDPESTVRILIQNGVVDGRVQFHGIEYRIIDGASGQAIVTEAKKMGL